MKTRRERNGIFLRRSATMVALWAGIFTAAEAGAQTYTMTTATRTFTSIRATGTPGGQAGQDDNYAPISAPFAFNFFGSPISAGTTLYATTNGLLTMGTASTSYSNTFIPSSGTPNGFIAPMWDDLTMTASGDIYSATQGTSGNFIFIVEWYQAASLNNTAETIDFQVRIYQATGVVEMIYGARAGSTSYTASIGLENAAGTVGVSMTCADACTPASVPSNSALVFTPSMGGTTGPDLNISFATQPPAMVAEGASLAMAWTVGNLGTLASSGTDIIVVAGTSPNPTINDYWLGEDYVPAVAAGGSTSGNMSLIVPSGISGTYYVAVIVDPYDNVLEGNEGDNTYSLGAVVVGGGGNSITVLQNPLPPAQLGVAYDQQLQQTGATVPYWYISTGSLPPGLTLSTTGRVGGVANTEGSYTFRVACEQEGLNTGFGDFTVSVSNGNTGGLRLDTPSLSAATVGVSYDAALAASGGTPPYAFQIISGRPDWLILDGTTGRFSGVPTGVGSHSLTISVFDSEFRDATAVLSLDVVAAGELRVETSLPNAVANRPFTARVVSGGIPPYTINVVGGALPEGFSVNPQGILQGQATAPGSFAATLQVTDSNTPQGTAQGNITLVITMLQELRIATRDISVFTNVDTDVSLVAQGGVAPYAWSISAGGLPGSLTLDPSSGRIIGRSDAVGVSNITVAVTDSEGTRQEAEIVVRSSVFRANDTTGRGRTGRGSGCRCVPAAATGVGASAWLVLGFAALLGVRHRRRRTP